MMPNRNSLWTLCGVMGVLTMPLAYSQQTPRRSDFINYEGEHCDIAFPAPKPAIQYKIKVEASEIDTDGLLGWSMALPVYGGDLFAVDCYDVNSPALKNKSDLQFLKSLLTTISGLDELVPDKRTIGVDKWPGQEFLVTYENGTRTRIAYCRHKQRFYLLIAICANSQPSVAPDPFASEFVMSPNVEYFFNSLKLKQ